MKIKKKTLYFSVMLFLLLLINNQGRTQNSIHEKTISILQSKIQEMMQQVDVPGLSITVIQGSKIVWSNGFGITDYESKNPVTANTIFEAGSSSKPVFTYAVLKLVDRGLLDLDKPLSSYLPVNYIIAEQIDLVTARMVLSHTTGFPLWWPDGEDLKIHFTPGDKFSYSSEGFVYLQNIVETVAEKSLPIFMKEYVFEPLNMTNSSFIWEDRCEKQVAFGHNQFGQEESPWKRNRGNAASSLVTTAEDYAKFMIAILNNTGLSLETYKEMLHPHTKLDPNCIDCTTNQVGTLSQSLAWGLGWGIYGTDGEKLLWHWGDNLRYTSFSILSKDQKSGLVYFTNGSNGLTLANDIVSQFFGDISPILNWLNYDDYDSPAMIFQQTVLKKGAQKGLTKYFQLKQNSNRENFISENAINNVGYILLNINRIPEAIDIFRLNVEKHPDSWNVYDSLAEAYAVLGDKKRAINYYHIALNKVEDQSHKNRIIQVLQDLQN